MPPEPNAASAPLILASQSPRRIELMRDAGYEFEVRPADVVESEDPELSPAELTMANAGLKAAAVADAAPDAIVLGADTLVYFEGRPLGKPRDLDHAVAMLTRLQGNTHQVCTGVAIIQRSASRDERFHVITDVTFKRCTPDRIRAYLAKIDPLDKAGGYAAQDHGAEIIDHFDGSWTNIVGLPMEAVQTRLPA